MPKSKNVRIFKTGKIFYTCGIKDLISYNNLGDWITNCLSRHINCDWGDLCNSDKLLNEQALITNERLFSNYNNKNSNGTPFNIYIITEHDRSITTILLSDEY
jgi:hypothetical protein